MRENVDRKTRPVEPYFDSGERVASVIGTDLYLRVSVENVSKPVAGAKFPLTIAQRQETISQA